MIHAREDYNRIQDPENKIPADEPVFLIRAHDVCSVSTLNAWIEDAELMGVASPMIDAAKKQLEKFREWQYKHGAKIPDL